MFNVNRINYLPRHQEWQSGYDNCLNCISKIKEKKVSRKESIYINHCQKLKDHYGEYLPSNFQELAKTKAIREFRATNKCLDYKAG